MTWRERLHTHLFPPPDVRSRRVARYTIAVLLAAYVLILLSLAWPDDMTPRSDARVVIWWVLFLARGLSFHAGLLILLLCVGCARHRQWRLIAAALPAIAATLAPEVLELRPRTVSGDRRATWTVLSANLLMINRTTGPILEEIRREDPDILLLQEYSSHWHETLEASLAPAYGHRTRVVRDDSFGTAIYSRIPFVGLANHALLAGEGIPQTRAVVNVHGRELALYNVHPLPPRRLDYVIDHRRQVLGLLDRLRREPLAAVIGGDFNFTHRSPQADRLAELGVVEGHSEAGWGRGDTWPVIGVTRWLPGLRLDHVYLKGDVECVEHRTGVGLGSDHRPIFVRLRWRPALPMEGVPRT